MHSILKIIWIITFFSCSLALILSYAYLPESMVLYGFPDISISKNQFFNTFLVFLTITFFLVNMFRKGIKEMNWAFLFPFGKKWTSDPETRDAYRLNILTWFNAVFSVYNLIFLFVLLLLWSVNDRAVYYYYNLFSYALIFCLIGLFLVLIVPPVIIRKGPQKN